MGCSLSGMVSYRNGMSYADAMSQPPITHAQRVRTFIHSFALLAALAIFVSLELARWHDITMLQQQGYAIWGNNGFYVRDVPGHLLCLTWMSDQFGIVMTTLLGGSAIYLLIGIFQPKELWARPPKSSFLLWVTRAAVALACLPILLGIYSAKTSPPIVVIDLDDDMITPLTGPVIPFANVVSFGSHGAGPGHPKGWYVGVLTRDGMQVDLLPIDSSHHYYLPFEAHYVATVLQNFVTSHGHDFPLH
jgi:hypothetical protein